LNRFHTAVVASLLLGTTIGGLLLAAPPLAAHATRIVGEYELTVGWRVEPAIVALTAVAGLIVYPLLKG